MEGQHNARLGASALALGLLLLGPAHATGSATGAAAAAVAPDGATPLLQAVAAGDVARVRSLIKAGADVRAANAYGATPMGEAARTGDTELIRLLLKAGASPESANAEGQTALMAVARTGNIEAARVLLKAGARIDAREHWGGQTALIWAAAQQQPAMIRFLLSRGAAVDAASTVRDWQRRVTAEGRPKDMNRGGMTPLLYAAREGCVDCARALIDGKAAVDLADPDGVTPLILALMNGHWDTARLLVEAGADVNLWDFWGQTPLYMAVDMSILPAGQRVELPTMDAATGHDLIALLLSRGANPNAQLKLRPPYRNAVFDRNADFQLIEGATPLLRAAVGADLEAIRALLAAGARVDLPNFDGVTPLMAAVSASGTRGRFKTEAQAIEAVKLLQAAGADVNAGGRSGLTAAHSAAFRGWHDMLKLLAGLGANLDATERDQLTPLDYAMGRSRVGFLQTRPPVRTETAAVLRTLGAKVENPNLPPWPGMSTPTITANVPD